MFDQIDKIKFDWVPICIHTGIHSLSNTPLMAILNEKQLFLFRLIFNESKSSYTIECIPFSCYDLQDLGLYEPISLRYIIKIIFYYIQ